MVTRKKTLPLSNIWEVYCQHPERATPATVHEHYSYTSSFKEFADFIGSDVEFNDVSPTDTNRYSEYLKATDISVSTHNRRRIWIKQFKTGKEVTIPIAPKLLDVLKEARDWQTNHYVCPNVAQRYNKVDVKGKNTGNNLVNIDMLRVIK